MAEGDVCDKCQARIKAHPVEASFFWEAGDTPPVKALGDVVRKDPLGKFYLDTGEEGGYHVFYARSPERAAHVAHGAAVNSGAYDASPDYYSVEALKERLAPFKE